MIIPIRHDQSEVRRWPWVSGAIMLLCLASFLAMDVSEYDAIPTEDDYLAEAADYWRERAYLDAHPEVVEIVAYDVMPNERSTYLELLKEYARDTFEVMTDEEVEAQQAELDALTDYGLGRASSPELTALDQHPYFVWGYVPASDKWSGLVTSIFVHAGWLHLLGNLFMFWLAGPAIEDRLGRPGFAVFFLMAGAFSAAFYGWLAQDPDMPLVGASGAIAGAMGAFLLRFWHSQIKFAYFFLVGFRPIYGTFHAQAWFILPLWLGNEILQAWWDRASGFSSGVAYEAHIGGFLFGAAVLAGMRAARIEERFLEPVLESKVTHFEANPIVAEADAHRAEGDLASAWAKLEGAYRETPDDYQVAFALWVTGLAIHREADAADALSTCIAQDVKQGELDLAARNWCELTNVVPEALCDASLLVKLLPTLREHDDEGFAIRALRHIVDPDNGTTTPAIALRILETARELDPPSALGAARRALESPELHEAKRAKLLQSVAALEAEGVVSTESVAEAAQARLTLEARYDSGDRAIEIDLGEDDAPTPPLVPPVPVDPPPFEELKVRPREIEEPAPRGLVGLDISESTLDDIDLDDYDLSEYEDAGGALDAPPPVPAPAPPEIGEGSVAFLAPRFADLKVVEARPVALADGKLSLELAGGKAKKLPLANVEGLAVGIVADQGPRPVLMIDLVLNWRSLEDDQGRVVRLRSDRLDPTRLVQGAPGPKEALRALLSRMLQAGGSEAIPTPESVCGPDWPRFETLAAYERELLGVDR